MDTADYLGFMGRWDECRNEYEKLIEAIPDHSFVRIRFARTLKSNYPDEAVASYKYVLQMNQAYEEDLKIAAEELRKLASSYNIELDAWTKGAIGNILG